METGTLMASIDEQGSLTGVGRARRALLATFPGSAPIDWEETEVKWDETHEQEYEGYHHATIARFLQERHVRELWAAGAGPDMRRLLERLDVKLHLAGGNAREVIAADIQRTGGSSSPAAP